MSAMKVSVLQENLSQGLSIVSRAVSPRSTLPVLANVLIATDEGRLRLSATNLEMGIRTSAPLTRRMVVNDTGSMSGSVSAMRQSKEFAAKAIIVKAVRMTTVMNPVFF